MSQNRVNIPLCVDLDGTLIKSDMLIESLLLLIKRNPLFLLIFPFWILNGLPQFKKRIFSLVEHDCSTLPYNLDVLQFIKDEKSTGRKVYLVTASPLTIAKSINDYLDIFDEVFGTDEKVNLKGINKANFLVQKFGDKNFDYVGDSKADFKVWEKAAGAVVVSTLSEIINGAKQRTELVKIFGKTKSKIKLVIKELRIYQWVKNLLLIFPVALAHTQDFSLYLDAFFAFISFGLVASSVYVVNDLLDLQSDRLHPRKRNRPFASSDLPLIIGFIATPILLISGFGLALFINIKFTLVLAIYYLLTTLYSFYLKKLANIDILTLAGLYTIRLVAGSVATDVVISKWMLAFSLFTFTGLAILKRYTELLTMKAENKSKTSGRGYEVGDEEILVPAGIGAGLLSLMVFALYINSPEIEILYSNISILWLVVPALLYWILHLWISAKRGKMTDDPIVFTVKDKNSRLVFLAIFIFVVLATL